MYTFNFKGIIIQIISYYILLLAILLLYITKQNVKVRDNIILQTYKEYNQFCVIILNNNNNKDSCQ